MNQEAKPPLVLILGAGINGCALARELVLNGVSVCIVDKHDIAFGATSASSRLIHGGLRYLEYGDFKLVKESLHERGRLLQLAPQFVQPLRLHIPVRKRFGGLTQSALRFLRLSRFFPGRSKERGVWLVRMGLWMYDRFSGRHRLEKHKVLKSNSVAAPRINTEEYPWICAYTDAQILYPERFCIAMLEDARQHAADRSDLTFEVYTHHEIRWEDGQPKLYRNGNDQVIETLNPDVIVNATGAWGDQTLEEMSVPAKRLFGGTKGSHYISFQPELIDALGGQGVYAEASDGRLIFVLPWAQGVMVGTTDEHFQGPPEQATASEEELNYLLEMTNELFPHLTITRDDILLHYCGVRPLPYVPDAKPGAIPRGHSTQTHKKNGLPVFTLIGGKLTTCRAFAEEVANKILETFPQKRILSTRDRMLPGGEKSSTVEAQLQDQIQEQYGVSAAQINALWPLWGTSLGTVLREVQQTNAGVDWQSNLPGTQIPQAVVPWVLKQEWAATLNDLIERRLMLLYEPNLSRETLTALAKLLPGESDCETVVKEEIANLSKRHGRTVATGTS